MSNKPLFSVVLPTFNREEFLSGSVQSILRQKFKDFELIVVDDGSVDFTPEVMEYFVHCDKRVKYFRRKHEGIAPTRNFGARKAKGDWIVIQDSDDYSYVDRLTKYSNYIDKHPDVDIIYSSMDICDDHLNPVSVVMAPEYTYNKLLESQYIAQPTLCYRRSLALEIPYNKSLKYGEDWEFLLECGKAKKNFGRIGTSLVKYRNHGTNISITKKKEVDAYDKKMLKKFRD